MRSLKEVSEVSKRWQVALILLVILLSGIGITLAFGRKSGGMNFFQKSRASNLSQKAKEALSNGKLDEALQNYTEMTQGTPPSEVLAEGLFGIGDVQFEGKNFLEAKSGYEKVIHDFAASKTAGLAQERLGKVNVAILFSPLMTPTDKKIEVQPGDSLAKIAKAHETTVDLLMKANQLQNSLIRPGMKLKVPGVHFSIIVDKSQNTLTLKAGEEIFKVYTVATGENNSTPVGTFKITDKLVNPVWYTLGAVVPPESPENVLGSRWLGINEKGYGIHGTRDLSSMGKQITKGCVRMRNEEVEELYAVVPIGTEVTIID